jgi:protoheme ferro-lyase
MPTTHVWLLDRGGPEAEADVRPWLEAIARDPTTSPLPSWMVFLLAWAWSHWAARRVVPVCRQIGGPAPQLSDAREQARSLQQVLGKRYAVHPVFRKGGEDAAAARATLAPGDQVVLLPLHPQRHPEASRAALAAAWKALSAQNASTTAVEAWGDDLGLVHLLARRVRGALIDLQEHGPTGLVLAAAAPPAPGSAVADDYLTELTHTAVQLRDHLNFKGPVVQAWIPALAGPKAPAPTVASAVATCKEKGAASVIVLPTGCTTSWPELGTLTAEGLSATTDVAHVRVLPPLAPSTDFARLLAQLVRAAEREAGWTVPEDEVRNDIEAELRAAGHRTLSRSLT